MWMQKLMLESTLSSESLGQSSWIGQSYCSPLLCPCGLSHHTNSELRAEASPLLLARTALLCSAGHSKKGKPCYENNVSNEPEPVSGDRDLGSKSQHIKLDTRAGLTINVT